MDKQDPPAERPGDAAAGPGHDLNPLQRLIQQRLRERGWSCGDVDRRGGLPRSTVYTLTITPNLARPPRPATIGALAEGLDVPVSAIRAAAAKSTGLHYYDDAPARPEDPDDGYGELLIASIDELTPEDRRHVAALGESLAAFFDTGYPPGGTAPIPAAGQASHDADRQGLATQVIRCLPHLAMLRLTTLPAWLNFAAGGGAIGVFGAVLLWALVHAGLPARQAMAVQLVVTLIMNFAYNTRVTWRNRDKTGLAQQIAWFAVTRGATQTASYFAFAWLISHHIGYALAYMICLAGATVVNFVTSDKLVFRAKPAPKTAPIPQQARHNTIAATEAQQAGGIAAAIKTAPATGRVTAIEVPPRVRPAGTAPARSSDSGVTVVLPAYGEEANLAATVEDMLRTLETAAEPHQVVIVNDGSPDGTGQVAEELAARYPGRIEVVHHEVNRGYGAAVRTGIRQALERTDSRRIFLTDSDGQFKGAELPAFIEVARNERADAVIGFRTHRADPPFRKVNAFLWGLACRFLLRLRLRDIDCAYKLVDRRVLADVRLRGPAATISPELLLRLEDQGARVLQRPVEHFPRLHGEPTGAKLPVILASLRGLVGLWLEDVGTGWAGRTVRRLVHPQDKVLWWLTAVSALASVAAFGCFASRHVVLAYPDAVSHMLIARRVLDASTPGVAQLGAVWLPLPHLLILPFVWVNSWYYPGLAGSLISMICYVLTSRYLYQTATGLTGNRITGLVAAAFFASDPNVLYLQSTPMTELLLIACIAATVYHLMRWCQAGSYRQLGATAAAALLGTLSRYEAWVLDAAVLVIIAWVAWQREPGLRLRERLGNTEGHLIFYGTLAFSGIAGWVLWNAVIFHNPFYFQDGAFAKPSLWVPPSDLAVHHWRIAAETYFYAMVDNVGWLALALSLAGLGCYVARTRLRAESLAPLAPLVIIPFYVYALWAGQRPLHVMQINGSLYNVRFGVLTVLPVALFLAYLAAVVQAWSRRWLRAAGYGALCCAVAAASLLIAKTGVDTLTEPEAFQASASQLADNQAAAWLRTHYHGGKVLMESFGNETVTFESHIPLGLIIYEGSYREWQPALRDPLGQGIRWIYMRRQPGGPDAVWLVLHRSRELSHYLLVYADAYRLIYRER